MHSHLQRQLNIGGSCPGGYVCCRNPRQNNFNKPSGSSTNNFQQVSNSPFGGQGQGQNGINSFNQGQGQCGKRNARGITGRISNPGFTEGDTDYGEYPWQVAILKKDGYDNVYVCGGALIDSKYDYKLIFRKYILCLHNNDSDCFITAY